MNRETNVKKELVSILIPCYGSEHYLADTVEGIRKTFGKSADLTCQLILINDGSPDGTGEVIHGLCLKYSWITGIDLMTNYGQGIAKMAGIPFIRGDYAVFMDDDGQHDPEAIPVLIDKVRNHYDLVYARFSHMEEAIWRKAASRINDLVLSLLVRKPRNITLTSFFALSKNSVDFLRKQSFYAGSVGYTLFPFTKKVTDVAVGHRKRTEGSSHYTIRKLFAEWFRVLKGSRRTIPAGSCEIRTIWNPPA